MNGSARSSGRIDGRYVRVREILHDPGVQHHATGALTLQPGELTSARLRDDVEATYALTLEARASRVKVDGTAHGAWVGPCRRCLKETAGELDVTIAEIFEKAPTAGETWPIDDGMIDLEPVLREALLLELPVAPLCRQDCAGPDPDRYPTAGAQDDEATEPVKDPRWSALDAFDIQDPAELGTDDE